MIIPGSSKKTAIHRKPQRYLAYPRNPQLQCCDRKCRASSTEMAVFFEGRQTQNSEDNIELGDGGGDMTSVVWYFMGWLFFFEEPGRIEVLCIIARQGPQSTAKLTCNCVNCWVYGRCK